MPDQERSQAENTELKRQLHKALLDKAYLEGHLRALNIKMENFSYKVSDDQYNYDSFRCTPQARCFM